MNEKSEEKTKHDTLNETQFGDRAKDKTASKWSNICQTPERFLWLVGTVMTFATQLVPVISLVNRQ